MASPKIKELRESFNMEKFKKELAKQINERIERIAYLNGVIEGLLVANAFTCLVTEIDGKPVMGDRLVVRKEIDKEIRKTIKKLEKIRKGKNENNCLVG